ncbi:MAG: alginate export family protein [Nitrospirota bacterium]
MRKFLAVLASMMLVLGFAASAFAVHADIPSETQAVVAKGTTQITLGGSVRVRGEIRDNTTTFGDDDLIAGDDHQSYYDQRVRLRIQADVSKNTTGVIHLENGSVTSSDYTWGTVPGENLGSFDVRGIGNRKLDAFTILEAWIQHKGAGLLGVPAGFKVGHMPVKLGYGLFYDHSKFGDDAINLFIDPMKDLHVELLHAKLSEGYNTGTNGFTNTNFLSNDGDLYSLLLNYNISKDSMIGADVSYLDVQNTSQSTDASFGAAARDYHLWNFGVRAQTNIAGFGIRLDGEYQLGEIDNVTGIADDYKAYAFLAGIDYTLAPVKLSLEFAYGSGDDDDDDDIETFQTLQSGIQKYTYVYDYRTVTAAGRANTGIANTWYIKAGASADIMKDLNALVNVYYLRAVKDASVDLNPRTDQTALTEGDSKNIGVEVDGKVTYKIDRNLVYWVEGGYLFAGSFFDRTGQSADDAYAVRHGIELSF